jgi:hypothetical protein
MNDENELDSKFPDMRPVSRAPSLSTFNGIGLSVYGARDYDQETGTYVKTHCLCLLFVPVLALGAYRVADAPQGWYFLGRVPLSLLAKLWNFLLIVGVAATIGVIFWLNYTGSVEYIAGQKLDDADRLVAAGELGKAADLYRQVATGKTSHASSARQKFLALFDGLVSKAPIEEALRVFAVAIDMHERFQEPPDLPARGLQLAQQHAPTDPRGALKLANLVAPLAPGNDPLDQFRIGLLTKMVQESPEDPEPAVELALVWDSPGSMTSARNCWSGISSVWVAAKGRAFSARSTSSRVNSTRLIRYSSLMPRRISNACTRPSRSSRMRSRSSRTSTWRSCARERRSTSISRRTNGRTRRCGRR